MYYDVVWSSLLHVLPSKPSLAEKWIALNDNAPNDRIHAAGFYTASVLTKPGRRSAACVFVNSSEASFICFQWNLQRNSRCSAGPFLKANLGPRVNFFFFTGRNLHEGEKTICSWSSSKSSLIGSWVALAALPFKAFVCFAIQHISIPAHDST